VTFDVYNDIVYNDIRPGSFFIIAFLFLGINFQATKKLNDNKLTSKK